MGLFAKSTRCKEGNNGEERCCLVEMGGKQIKTPKVKQYTLSFDKVHCPCQ